MKTLAVLSLLALSLTACDQQAGPTPTERIGMAIDEADISLAEAIAAAQAESGGVAIDAELEPEHGIDVYRVELMSDAGQRRVDISPEDASVLRSRDASSGNDEENAAAAALATGVDWAMLIAAAEAEVSGIAFEIEADGSEGVFDVELLADGVVWELELSADGTVLKSEQDDQFDDHGGDDDDDEHDEDEATDDHHGGGDDDGTDDGDTDDDNSGHE
ncbi:MAG TPA: PepSY domain-containing protein [Nannocystaceae bacterium]|nr:PepSY domain-containing protein [Nannocystaceae bacterium]